MHLRMLLTMARSNRLQSRFHLYQHLWELDTGFSQVGGALKQIQKNAGFDPRQLAQFSALIAEARAATLSYLLESIGESESREAGRLFRSRRKRERAQNVED
jgi:hypothetical protein